MANLAAKRPDYSGPDVATRWTSRPEGAGRPNREWIRKRLNRHGKDGTATDTELEQILDHQIEVAKSWEVRVIGRDGNGELLKVASARESVEAAKLLLSYAMGKAPSDPDEWMLRLAEHLRSVARDQIEIGRTILGKRLETMSDAQVASFLKTCDQDTRRFLVAAAITMGAQPPELPATPPAENQALQGAEVERAQPEAGSCCAGSGTDIAQASGEACSTDPDSAAAGAAPIATLEGDEE